MEQMLLGEILLNFHLISENDLARCIQIQERLDPRPLGEILIDHGLIDENILATVLNVQQDEIDIAQDQPGASRQDLSRTLESGSVEDYLDAARKLGASDLYLSSGQRPAVRRNGVLSDLPVPALTSENCRRMIMSLLTPEQVAAYERDKQIDVRVSTGEHGRFRANIFRHYDGIGGIFRVLNDDVVPYEELGLPQVICDLAKLKQGLVLVTGATGSGKSTTLAAIVDIINKTQQLHVITLEDPIENVFRSDQSFVSQREINSHTTSYAGALRSALREDPDVIVLGEMRDPVTVATALTAAETGHLVLGTLHTNTAYSTVVRIIDQFPAERRGHVRTMLSSVLRAVVCQELIPSIDGERRHIATEVMIANPAIANLIREGREWQIPNMMQVSTNQGMHMMDGSLKDLLRHKKITVEHALARATDKSSFMIPVRG